MPCWSLCVAPDRAISETVDFCNSLIIMREPWPDNSNRGGSLTSEEGVCANFLGQIFGGFKIYYELWRESSYCFSPAVSDRCGRA